MLSKIFSAKRESFVPWESITNISQLDEIDAKSKTQPILLFKHSTRCSISSVSLSRFERAYHETTFKPYFIDLIAFREVSNAIAERYGVKHESPQAILISHGQSICDMSHMSINYEKLNDCALKS